MNKRIESLQLELYEIDRDLAATIQRGIIYSSAGHMSDLANPEIVLQKKQLREFVFINLIEEQYRAQYPIGHKGEYHE